MSEKKLLVVVDMQKDFITGSLGTAEAEAIVPAAVSKIKGWQGDTVYTMDTHGEDYLTTNEGKRLPVVHCVKGTSGWELDERIKEALDVKGAIAFEKPTFGSPKLAEYVRDGGYDEIELIGICTDICVISNAMLIKAFVPEKQISVDASCCAGVSPESHENALKAMAVCHIDILG